MSTLVEAGGTRLLIDAGRGASIRLWQLGVSLGSIDAVFLTHFHSDHTIGLPDLWLTGWIDTPYGRLRFAGSGFKLAHGGGRLDRMAPELGADTDAVLAELGFDAADIAELRAREIV
jgi:glyoxylase-like metal-dependent hydrolase (beta-lactamase superfamily II)